MELVISALMLLCNSEVACEQKVNLCVADLEIRRDAQLDRETQSRVFRHCFENYIFEE